MPPALGEKKGAATVWGLAAYPAPGSRGVDALDRAATLLASLGRRFLTTRTAGLDSLVGGRQSAQRVSHPELTNTDKTSP